MSAWLRGVELELGAPRPLDVLADGADTIRRLKLLGLRRFRAAEEVDWSAALADLAGRSLRAAGARRGSIGGVLVVSSSGSRPELERAGATVRAMLALDPSAEAPRILGDDGCTAVVTGLAEAARRATATGRGWLLLAVEDVRLGTHARVVPHWTVHSDGMAAAVVSAEPPGRAIGALRTRPRPPSASGERAFRRDFADLGAPLLRDSAVQERTLVPNNYNELVAVTMSGALGLDRARVFDRTLADHAHALGLDGLANLAAAPPDPALLFAFSTRRFATLELGALA